MHMIPPLLCTKCHNTEHFYITAEVDVSHRVVAGGPNQTMVSEPDYLPHSTVTCAGCLGGGTAEAIYLPTMTAPSIEVIPLITPVANITLIPEENGYSIHIGRFDDGRRIAGPLYYSRGLKGTVETPKASNVTESVTNWMVGVIRDSGLPLLENRETTSSEYALHLEGLRSGDKELILARCKAEGIGGY